MQINTNWIMEIELIRVYDLPENKENKRILVDKLWPRGKSKEKIKIDFWAKEIAPSNELRKWYGHDPIKWEVFKVKYFKELDENEDKLRELIGHIEDEKEVTFVYSSQEGEINNATALKLYLQKYLEII